MSLIFYNLIERDNGSLLKLIVLIFSDYYALLYFTLLLLYYGLGIGRNYCGFVSRLLTME